MVFFYKLLLMASLITLASACTSVAPWQRGTLAKPEMALDPNPMQSMIRAHIHTSREAGSASTTGSGGGCGCY